VGLDDGWRKKRTSRKLQAMYPTTHGRKSPKTGKATESIKDFCVVQGETAATQRERRPKKMQRVGTTGKGARERGNWRGRKTAKPLQVPVIKVTGDSEKPREKKETNTGRKRRDDGKGYPGN